MKDDKRQTLPLLTPHASRLNQRAGSLSRMNQRAGRMHAGRVRYTGYAEHVRFTVVPPFTALCITLAVGLGIALATCAAAQQPSTTAANGAQQTPPFTFGDGTQGISDVFLGRNVTGPYLLSWRGIESGSEVVTLGAQRLTRDTDYHLDTTAGVL